MAPSTRGWPGDLCYRNAMIKRPLIKTNPYLADPVKRREMFVMTVYTSTGVEGVRLDASDLNDGMTTEHVQPIPRESVKSS